MVLVISLRGCRYQFRIESITIFGEEEQEREREEKGKIYSRERIKRTISEQNDEQIVIKRNKDILSRPKTWCFHPKWERNKYRLASIWMKWLHREWRPRLLHSKWHRSSFTQKDVTPTVIIITHQSERVWFVCVSIRKNYNQLVRRVFRDEANRARRKQIWFGSVEIALASEHRSKPWRILQRRVFMSPWQQTYSFRPCVIPTVWN